MLPSVFATFVQQRPIAVMAHALLHRLFDPSRLDSLFERVADRCYHRQLRFSALVELMADVVLRIQPSVYAAYRSRSASLGISDTALYNKLARVELPLAAELVTDSAAQAAPVIDALGGRQPSWLPGYRVRILDGNFLAATEHRLTELRTTWAAAMPGKVLVVLEPDTGLAVHVALTPDGHAQERSLCGDILPQARQRDLWVADRNFCTHKFLFGLARRQASFVVRQHGQTPGKPVGKRRFLGTGPTGRVYEQTILFTHEGETLVWRRVSVELDQATRDGDWVIHILTNVASEQADALKVAELYGKRWTIEGLFLEMTQMLGAEPSTLGYPPAALFAFCLGLQAANAVAVLKAALRAGQGAEKADEVSGYYLGLEIEQASDGLRVAIPQGEWERLREMGLGPFAKWLKEVAARINLKKYEKTPRGPRKKRPPRTAPNGGHVSTYKLLAQRKKTPPP
jgi:DDE family transposase